MQASNILSQVGIRDRPAYYSGRGASYGDLTAEKLIGIKNLIKEHYGDKAAINFLLMVEAMPDLGATDFINNLFSLEGNNWEWKDLALEKSNIDIERDEKGNHSYLQAFITIASLAHGNTTMDKHSTESMKEQLLRASGIPIWIFNARKQDLQKGKITQEDFDSYIETSFK